MDITIKNLGMSDAVKLINALGKKGKISINTHQTSKISQKNTELRRRRIIEDLALIDGDVTQHKLYKTMRRGSRYPLKYKSFTRDVEVLEATGKVTSKIVNEHNLGRMKVIEVKA